MPNREDRDRQIVVMGVMGAGKTTIGTALAKRLACPFYDADDLHSRLNRLKLAKGEALSAEDRGPWVERVAALIRTLHHDNRTAVIACSALTASIREQLASAGDGVVFVHLEGTAEMIRRRLAGRAGHFADPTLLDSQIATLEVPSDAIVADTSGTPDEVVDGIIMALHLN